MINDVPEFYYVTENAMVCPPLDGLESSEIYSFEQGYDSLIAKMSFASKLQQMVPADSESKTYRSLVQVKVASYMNKKHGANYIVYNLFRDRQLDKFASYFHQVTEYPFPRAIMVAELSNDGMLEFVTPPPALRQLFLVVLEMASWINSCSQENYVVLIH